MQSSGNILKPINPLYTCDIYMRTLANSKYPDEMPHHQGLHCLLKDQRPSKNERHFYL